MEINLTPAQHKYYGALNDKMRKLKGEAANIFRSAKDNHRTHTQILEDINQRVYNYQGFRRNKERYNMFAELPVRYRSAITAYIDGCLDMHMMHCIEWILYYDGKYIGNSRREKEETDAMYKLPDFDQSKVQGYHVYIGTGDKY